VSGYELNVLVLECHMTTDNITSVYAELYEQLYLDIAEGSATPAQQAHDLGVIRKRVRDEGLSFLTKTMPLYGKAIDKALSSTVPFDPDDLVLSQDTGIPSFLGFLFERVFESAVFENRSVLLPAMVVDVGALRHLRQLCSYLYKLELPYDEDAIDATIGRFVETDCDLENIQVDSPVYKDIVHYAAQFACSVFGSFDHRSIIPRHGPGSVATGESSEGKITFSRLYKDLDLEYPFTEYFMSGLNHVADEPEYIAGLNLESEAKAKIVLVPKDSRGPRVISMEPLELQWIQQGLMRAIVPHLESHRLTTGHVNFTDQEVNRRLALLGSSNQEWATLDMKDASDRVSMSLVESVFIHCPMLAGLKACRSVITVLPDCVEMRMKKFAPMGSALCFPVESFIFYALSIGVLVRMGGYSRSKARRAVYVYGDDMIVRAPAVELLLKYLPVFGLRFNDDKCCYSGSFRESCGCDAYRGEDITPIRLRKTIVDLVLTSKGKPRRRTHLSAVLVASAVAQSNQLHRRYYYRAAEYIRRLVEWALNQPLPLSDVPTFDYNTLLGVLSWERPEVPNIRVFNKQRFKHRIHGKNPLRPCFSRSLELYSWRVCVPNFRKHTGSWRSVLSWFSNPRSETPGGTYADPSRILLKKGWSLIDARA